MTPSNSPSSPIRVLLIEDNPDDVLILRELLSDAPVRFEIQTADLLAQAGEHLRSKEFDVVLADLSLPDSKGIETFRALRKVAPLAPVIVLSGLDDEAMALKTVEEGAQDYLVKGQVTQPLLVRSIRYAMKRAEAERVLADERNLLRSVIDNLVDAVYVKDLSGRYLLGNIAHARQFGLVSPEQIIGKTTGELFPSGIAQQFRADDENVIQTGEAIINRHECVADEGEPLRWLSTTKVPLRDSSGNIVGVVGIGRDITARKQAEEQLARYTQELRDKNAEMEEDMNMAREVQQAFLPQQFPSFPPGAPLEQSSLRFYSKYLPTTTLGGDFFHILPISESRAGVFICDVMGHGVRAALVTAIQRALVEELTEFATDPGAFLTQMNEALLSILRRTRSPMFASAFYAMIDAEAGRATYANAGHPRPLHVSRSLHRVVLMDGPGARPGPALGVFEGSKYLSATCAIDPGDMLLFFTDGLYEVENARGELYDQNLLLHAVQERAQLPTDQIFDELIQEVRSFSVTKSFVDDVCMVGVELASTSRAIYALSTKPGRGDR